VARIPGSIWYEHHVISGNYRWASFKALFSMPIGPLEQQTKTRERNGTYLASKLARLPGLYPQTPG